MLSIFIVKFLVSSSSSQKTLLQIHSWIQYERIMISSSFRRLNMKSKRQLEEHLMKLTIWVNFDNLKAKFEYLLFSQTNVRNFLKNKSCTYILFIPTRWQLKGFACVLLSSCKYLHAQVFICRQICLRFFISALAQIFDNYFRNNL